MKQKLLITCLAAVLSITSIPQTALTLTAAENVLEEEQMVYATNTNSASVTASGTCGDNATWELTEDGVLTISGSGAMDDYYYSSFPWSEYTQNIVTVVIEEGITSIGDNAFRDCDVITSIEIPDSVTSIGDAAFCGCRDLTSIEIPDSVTSIGYSAFAVCRSLTSIEIPNGVTSIGRSTFSECYSLTSIEIPDSVTSIGDFGFYSCSALTSIEIPDSVTSIGEDAFSWCEALTSIEIPDSVTSIGEDAFYWCEALIIYGYEGSYAETYANENDIPFDYISTSVTGISLSKTSTTLNVGATEILTVTISPDNATNKDVTWRSSDTSVATVTDGAVTAVAAGTATITATSNNGISASCTVTVEAIVIASGTCGDNATWELTEDGVLTISGSGAMEDYNSFSDVPWSEYRWDNIVTVVVGEGITSIGDYAFHTCSRLTSIEIPDSVTSIGDSAFDNCHRLTSIEIPNGVTSIEDSAFFACSGLTSIEIPDSVTYIGDYAFASCRGLTSIEIPDSVTCIGIYTFGWCESLTSIEIPDSVTHIESYAFQSCYALTSIEIPSSVCYIASGAFGNCISLTSIRVDEKNLNYRSVDDVLYDKEQTSLICCPGSKTGAYTISSSVTHIKSCAFMGCSGLTSIEIPDSVTSIGSYTFGWCESLTSIEIPDSVTSIGYDAFSGCGSLTIYGYEGSYAETYANANNIPFDYISIPVTEISLNKSSATLNVGANEILTVTISPDNATNKDVTWTSSDSSVATVDSNGLVTAVAPGSATITVATVDGGRTASCMVTVTDLAFFVNGVPCDGTLLEVIAAAEAGSVITLRKDVDLGEAGIVPSTAITLDLNGNTLTASYFVAFEGTNVVDNSEAKTGVLKVVNSTFDKANTQIPVYNGVDGYVFATVVHQEQRNSEAGENTFELIFRPSLGKGEVVNNTLLANGGDVAGITIGIRLEWTVDGETKSKDLVYGDDLVKEVYNNGKAFYIKALSTNNFDNLKITPLVQSQLNTGIVSNGTEFAAN